MRLKAMLNVDTLPKTSIFIPSDLLQKEGGEFVRQLPNQHFSGGGGFNPSEKY